MTASMGIADTTGKVDAVGDCSGLRSAIAALC